MTTVPPLSNETTQLARITQFDADLEPTFDAESRDECELSAWPTLEGALDRHRHFFAGVPESLLVDIRTDVPTAASRVLTLVPRWAHLRAHIVEVFASPAWRAVPPQLQWFAPPEEDPVALLVSIADATLQAHAEYLTAMRPTGQLAVVLKHASELRKRLLIDARVLEGRQLLPRGSLRNLRRHKGYVAVAIDLMALVSMLQEHWHSIEVNCAVTTDELAAGRLLANTLFRNAYNREARVARQAAASSLRTRAFSVLHYAYADLRRCIAFLQPTAHRTLAPSLYTGRGGRGRPPQTEGVPSARRRVVDPRE